MLESINVAELRPNDILVIKSSRHLSPEMVERITDNLQAVAPGHRTLVIDAAFNLEIVRPVCWRTMMRGDLFNGIGGWVEDGEYLDRIAWLTTEETAEHVRVGATALLHPLDKVT